jgi:3-deoxy-D-manno-octulosonic-acid transferase
MWRYTLLTILLAVPVLLYTLWQALRNGDGHYFRERMGLYGRSDSACDLWIHAASVGEVNAVIPLVQVLQQRYPELLIRFTTNTPSGGLTARNKLPPQVNQHYLPFDWMFAVRRFLRYLQPRRCLIVETELWPNLYHTCAERSIHITIINGRISERTLGARPWMRKIYAATLQQVTHILARSETDRLHFIQLGANSDHIETLGNIKFADPGSRDITPFTTTRPYVLAASTREGEEQRILQAWLSSQHGDHLLVIVPRHPQRLAEILRELQPYQQEIAVRSRQEQITADTGIYIADTFGELESFIAGAKLVIMGGSLEPFGGQNILEVARAGKAVLIGPHMENFVDESQLLLNHEAAIQVDDTQALHHAITTLVADPQQLQRMGQQGRQVIEQRAGMVDEYIVALERIGVLPHSSGRS